MATVIDGSASVTINSGAVLGITSGTAVASTSGTSVNFTDIPSWVKRITVMLSGVSTSAASNILVQIGSGSVTTSGYLSGASNYVAYTSATTGLLATYNNSAGSTWGGAIEIRLINPSTNAWVSSGILNDSSAGAQVISNAGSVALSGTLDRVRITTVNGTDTFDAGSINILYE